jgi:hypothetical protein
LNVHSSQTSRDERNEYHGVTLERAERVLDAHGATIHAYFELVSDTSAVA